MLYPLPSNVIPFLILGISATLFGIRGLYFYNRRKSPLSLYYSLGVIFIGISNIIYAVPFLFTRDEQTLQIWTSVGDQFYFLSILIMARLIWYLGFNKKIHFNWIFIPYFILIVGCNLAVYYSWTSVQFQYVGNSVIYPVSQVASWFFAAMSSAYVFVGFLTIKQARSIQDLRQKIRLNSIGIAFLLGGLIAIYNYLFLQGTNTGSVGTVGYIGISVILFVGIFIISRKTK